MCCIIHRPKGAKAIPLSNLESIIKINDDGWGVSYFKDGPHCVKSMVMGDAIEKIRELEKEDLEFLFHARYTTHGDTNLANCHPYEIDGGLLFHNGKIDIHCREKKFSDTYYFARKVTRYFRVGKTLEWILKRCASELGLSRLAIMADNGEITKHGTWHEQDECFYSKLNWKWGPSNYGNYWGGYSEYDYGKYSRRRERSAWLAEDDVRVVKSQFKDLLENCENGTMIFTHLVKSLTEEQLIKIAIRYPDLCAEYITRSV